VANCLARKDFDANWEFFELSLVSARTYIPFWEMWGMTSHLIIKIWTTLHQINVNYQLRRQAEKLANLKSKIELLYKKSLFGLPDI
jgi:hypothetical protein